MKKIIILSTLTAIVAFIVYLNNFNSYKEGSFVVLQELKEIHNNELKSTWGSNENEEVESKKVPPLSDKDKIEAAWNGLSEEKNFIKYINAISDKNKVRAIPLNIQDKNKYIKEREELEKHLDITDKIVSKNAKLKDLDEYFIYYNNIRNDIDNYSKAEKYLDKAIEKGFFTKKYNRPSSVPIQQYKANTCVVNTLSTIMKYQYWKSLNEENLYRLINKENWDYWMSEYFHYDWFERRGEQKWDYIKLASLWIYSEYITSMKEVRERLNKWEIALYQWPLELFSNSDKWKWSNIYHAVTVFSIEGNVITYGDSLDGKIKKMDISHLIDTKWQSQNPFRFFSFNNSKIDEIEGNLFTK